MKNYSSFGRIFWLFFLGCHFHLEKSSPLSAFDKYTSYNLITLHVNSLYPCLVTSCFFVISTFYLMLGKSRQLGVDSGGLATFILRSPCIPCSVCLFERLK